MMYFCIFQGFLKMKNLPDKIDKEFEIHLKNKMITVSLHGFYKKWLKYYFDFCEKYGHPFQSINSVNLFLEKLKNKNQSFAQIKQAKEAVFCYFEMLKSPVLSTGETAMGTKNNANSMKVQYPVKKHTKLPASEVAATGKS